QLGRVIDEEVHVDAAFPRALASLGQARRGTVHARDRVTPLGQEDAVVTRSAAHVQDPATKPAGSFELDQHRLWFTQVPGGAVEPETTARDGWFSPVNRIEVGSQGRFGAPLAHC